MNNFGSCHLPYVFVTNKHKGQFKLLATVALQYLIE